MDVGARELKARLSEYLERAARGELLRITDRGRPKAMMGPLPQETRLQSSIDEGWIRAGSTDQPCPVRRRAARRRIADVLTEDRGS
jgi:antitoxin (DNA-binding transcriptional repressor) of toxin-antitoxin stability system